MEQPPPPAKASKAPKKREKSPANKVVDNCDGDGDKKRKKKKNDGKTRRNKDEPGEEPSKKMEECKTDAAAPIQAANELQTVPLKPDSQHAVGDVWWSNMLGKACKQLAEGVDISEPPHVKDGEVIVQFPDGTTWNVPHLVPQDLGKGTLPSVPKAAPAAPKKPKAKAKSNNKPVPDFELPTVRCKHSLQGKNPAIVKIEVREDRNDLGSKFKQKAQIVIKDNICVRTAMNVASTFAECYEYMNLNPSVLNFRECRDALLGMAEAGHDWSKQKLDWRYVAGLCLKGFPPKCLGRTIVSIVASVYCCG